MNPTGSQPTALPLAALDAARRELVDETARGRGGRAAGGSARLETDNPEFLLALLDARHVAGGATLVDRFLALFHRPEMHAFILDSLERLIADRHALFNDTLYQLEPDIKDAPGALRDLMALRVIARLTDPALPDIAPP